MERKDPKLLLQAAPFLKRSVSTPGLMLDVIIGMLPALFAALWFFRLSALLVLLASVAGAVLTEAVFTPASKRRKALGDGSAVLTGLLLGLVLPPATPLWIAAVGGAVSIGLGKQIWGGLGHNMFNPALVGRAFLQASFPAAMTTWTDPTKHVLSSSNLALPFLQPGAAPVDAIGGATPLAVMKFEKKLVATLKLALGTVGGCLGETSGLAIILGGIWMTIRRTFDWRIPVSILLSTGLFSGALYLVAQRGWIDAVVTPQFMIFAGGLLFGAIYMATDPVTSPLAPRGTWIFGIGIGLLVVAIRLYGNNPEGVMYAILLMNAATPLIERHVQPRPFGRERASHE